MFTNHTKRHRLCRILVIFTALSIFAAACGGEDEDPAEAAPEPAAAPSDSEDAGETADPDPIETPEGSVTDEGDDEEAAAPESMDDTGAAVDDDPAEPEEAAEAPPMERPDLVVAMGNIPNHLSPLQRTTSHMAVTTNLFDNIVERDHTGGSAEGVVPGIAESWSFASPTELDLTIRSGVLFHDGTELTANDVVFSLTRLMGDEPLERDELARPLLSVEALDGSTVRITTRQPDPGLLTRLSSRIGRVVPESYYLDVGTSEFINNPIGSGPYRLVEFIGDDVITVEAFDEYWGGTPPAASIRFRDVPEVSSRIASLITGEAHIIDAVPITQLPILEAQGDIESRSVLSDRVVMLEFMTAQPNSPTANRLIRQAMVHAVDMGVISSGIWNDTIFVPNGLNLPVHGAFYDAGRARYLPFDTGRAQELLAEAGYSGEEIVWQWIAGAFPNFDSIAPVMVQMWEAVGLNVVLEPVADFTLLDYERGNIFTGNNYVAIQDVIEPLWTYWGPTARSVTRGRCVQPEEFFELGAILDSGAEQAERSATFARMLDLFDDNVCAFPLYVQPEIYGVASNIDWQPRSDFTMYFGPGNLHTIK